MTRKQSQPTTPKENTRKLIEEYQRTKNHSTQEQLVTYYKGFVESLAWKYSKGKEFHEDMVQVGMVGLLNAIERYDSSLGKSFESFAIPTIIGEIKRFLRDKTWSVHVPRRIKELGPRIKTAVDELTKELQRSPKVIEIAQYIKATEEEVLEAMEIGKNYQVLSVDHSIETDQEGSSITLLDIVGERDEGYEKVNQRLILERIIHVLSDREREVIQCTYFYRLNQKETGERLGISQMHVSRLQRRALEKLRKAALEGQNKPECFL